MNPRIVLKPPDWGYASSGSASAIKSMIVAGSVIPLA
jgi:hypothetical protein